MFTEPLIPVTLLTGFLGAGKTTLLNHILNGVHGSRIAVIVNDFGAINIDKQLVQSVDGEVLSLTNGCICCDNRADLRQTVRRLLERAPLPEHIVVEASGISDPLAVAAIFGLPELKERVRIDSVITLVDGENARDPHLDAQLIRDQIVSADLVVLNKIDLIDKPQSHKLRRWILAINPECRIVEAVDAEVPLAFLLGAGGVETSDRPVPKEHAHSHSLSYTAWSYEADSSLRLHELLAALKDLPATVFRAKGIVQLAEAPGLRVAVQVVGRRISTDILGHWDDEFPATRLVFIGAGGDFDVTRLHSRLNACRTDSIRPINDSCYVE